MTVRIELLRTQYPHWGAHSGINQFLYHLDPVRFSVNERLVPDSNDDFPTQNRFVRYYVFNTLKKRGMDWYKLSDLTAEARVFKSSLRGDVDVVHYLDGEHSARFLPSWCKRLNRRRPKVVGTYHQPPELLDSLVDKTVIRKLDCISVVSPEQVQYFAEIVGHSKVRVILHGIDTDFFTPRETPKETSEINCITVGHNLRDFDAVGAVANVLADHQEIRFQVVSSQPTGVEGLPNVKTYCGLDDVSLRALYQQADILFLPLLQTTANNALLEGIACGLPVVSTKLASVEAYLDGRASCLIENNNPSEMVEAILHLAKDDDARSSLGAEARARALELDWRNIAPLYEALYSELQATG